MPEKRKKMGNSQTKFEIIVPEDKLAERLHQALVVIAKLRHYERIWEHHYGAINKKNLKFWQDKADELLAELKIIYHQENKDTK